MLQRYFVDIFAGPGLNIDTTTGEEFLGSTLRALQITNGASPATRFTHAISCNLDHEDHVALRTRIDRLRASRAIHIPDGPVETIEGILRFLLALAWTRS